LSIKLPKDDYRNQPRVCTTCKKEKNISQFKLERDKRATNGIAVRTKCRECDEFRKYKRFIQKTYNISYEDYEKMFDLQNGCCAICKSKVSSVRTTRLFVDHCHDTLKVRGLLCSACNHALGLFKDSPTILKSAIKYLETDHKE
jgi:hypothetical protein